MKRARSAYYPGFRGRDRWNSLVDREKDAKRYAKAAVDYDPDPAYLDTLGLVMLNFGIANRDSTKVRRARELFTRVGRDHDFSTDATPYAREINRLHLEQATAALAESENWEI